MGNNFKTMGLHNEHNGEALNKISFTQIILQNVVQKDTHQTKPHLLVF